MKCLKGPSSYETSLGKELAIKQLTEEGTFSGHASVFGNVDLQGEIVSEGAFSRTIKHHDANFPLLWQHDTHVPIGTVKVQEDGKGLKVDPGKLILGVSQAKDAYELLKAGVVSGMSIGYRVIKDDYDRENGIRTLKEVQLHEVSLVTFPANERARVRHVKNFSPEEKELIDLAESGKEGLIQVALKIFSQDENEELRQRLENEFRKHGLIPPWDSHPDLKSFEETFKLLDQAKNLPDSEDVQTNSAIKLFDWMFEDQEPISKLEGCFDWLTKEIK